MLVLSVFTKTVRKTVPKLVFQIWYFDYFFNGDNVNELLKNGISMFCIGRISPCPAFQIGLSDMLMLTEPFHIFYQIILQ